MARRAPRPRLQQRRTDGSRNEIRDATRTVLARVGVAKLTLELVARELGITKQALYHYFPSKEALLLEIVLEEQWAVADAVHAACEAAPDGPSAVEALIRTYVGYFAPRLDAFRLGMLQVQGVTITMQAAELARVRPLNDRMYGAAEAKLLAEWPAAARRKDPLGPRRLVFTAHVAAMGLLSKKSFVEQLGDPLRYTDDELVDELCRTFRAAAERRGS